MDSNANETPGLGLPPTATSQNGQVDAGQVQNPVPDLQAVSYRNLSDENSDDLDEEWVNKAKAIVDETRNDPFLESRELNKVRADYLKARYNKEIKVSEDHD